ncbi:MAG: hypothetical protein RL291_1449 [Pseudomonadota bacterium]
MLGSVPVPSLVHAFDVEADVDPPIDVGQVGTGQRRMIPITGGRVSGPKLNGTVLPGGIDYQLIRPDLTAEIHARYVIETSAGAKIYVENTGLRHGPPDVIQKLIRGEPVDPALIYFRTSPRFETASADHAWMMKSLFVCSGARAPRGVYLRFYEVT